MEIALVHGAYHGAWCFERLIPALEERGHLVRAVDMPIGNPHAGAADYATAVIAQIEELENPVVVGHSMGGAVIPLVAASRPVRQLVFLAALLPRPGQSLQEQRNEEPIDSSVSFETVEFTEVEDGVWTVGPETATAMFYHDLPPATAAWAVQRLRPQSYVFMTEVTPLTSWPDVGCASIVCADDHALNATWAREASVARLGVDPLIIDGGHSPFLGRPEELAQMIDAVVV